MRVPSLASTGRQLQRNDVRSLPYSYLFSQAQPIRSEDVSKRHEPDLVALIWILGEQMLKECGIYVCQ